MMLIMVVSLTNLIILHDCVSDHITIMAYITLQLPISIICYVTEQRDYLFLNGSEF